MRRRALLAASMPSGGGGTYDEFFGQIPPESTSFQFPLYITVPFDEVTENSRYYSKPWDEIIQQLYDWFVENATVTDLGWMKIYELDNPDVYINGEKISQMYYDDAYVGDEVHYIYLAFEKLYNNIDCQIDKFVESISMDVYL